MTHRYKVSFLDPTWDPAPRRCYMIVEARNRDAAYGYMMERMTGLAWIRDDVNKWPYDVKVEVIACNAVE